MSSSMKMMFHSKQQNLMRKSNNVKRVPTPRQTTNPNNVASTGVFMGSMVERVNNARSGCSACGK